MARNLQPSPRGEYETTDVNRIYLVQRAIAGARDESRLCRADTGTHKSLMQAGQFIETIEDRQGLKIGCIEEIAWDMGFIDDAALEQLGNKVPEKRIWGVFVGAAQVSGE